MVSTDIELPRINSKSNVDLGVRIKIREVLNLSLREVVTKGMEDRP